MSNNETKVRQKMNKKQIISKKQYGDFNVVSQILTKKIGRFITPGNARQMVERENAKYHNEAMEALRQVVEARENILNNK